MKILVTGGAGFIGNNFIRYWLEKYPSDVVFNLDKLTYAGHLSSTNDFKDNKNYTFVKGDICDRRLVDSLVKGVDLIVHFAAESHVDRSIKDPEIFVKSNVLGTHVLLESALNNKLKRFHHVSTDEVFGSLPLNSTKKFNENTPYDPRSPYSASKAAADHFVRAYHTTYGLDVTITNCSNNFGPFQDPEKMLPRFITNLIDGKKVPIYGDGNYVRDWLFVEDHCRAIDVVVHQGTSGETYLVGGQHKEINNMNITRTLLSLFDYGDEMIEYVTDRPGRDRRYSVDFSKMKKNFKWEPQHEFDVWLEKTVAWYRENEWWWRPLKESSEKIYRAK